MLSFLRKKTVSQIISAIVLFSFMNLIQGCLYYRVQKVKAPSDQVLPAYEVQKKYIILHSSASAWHLSNITIHGDTVMGKAEELTGHTMYTHTKTGKLNRYGTDQKDVLSEIHVYIKNTFPPNIDNDGFVAFPAGWVDRIESYRPDRGATIGAVAGIGLGAIALVAIIVALTKESCPFIYIADGDSMKFVGEIYSGAIYPSLERQDYLPLPAASDNTGGYHILMTNEVHEIQNTNLVELLVFDHPAGMKVLVDKYGQQHTISNALSPVSTTNLAGRNIFEIIKSKDSLSYFGNGVSGKSSTKDGIIMTFKKPANATTAKIILNARSTYWLDYVFTRFNQLFGREYTSWVEKQKNVSPKKMQKWTMEQAIPMSLYLEKNGKWEFVDYFNITGPMAAKEDILAFSVSGIKSDEIKVKLEYGNLFWDIDYAGIDFSVDKPVNKKVVSIRTAIDEQEKDVKNLLSVADMLYYVQPVPGNSVDMFFDLPEMSDSARTLILHSQGHYRILLDLNGEQQVRELLKFRRKGYFPEFSNEIFRKQTPSDITYIHSN